MKEPIEVDAQIIEPEETALAVQVKPAVIIADFAMVEAKVRDLTKDYENVSGAAIAAMDLDQTKRCRAQLNGIKKNITDARVAVKREYEAPYKAFDEEVKRILKIVEEPLEMVTACVQDKERMIKRERKAHLEEVYAQFLTDNGIPSFAANVPFDRICETKWWDTTAKSYTPKKYEAELTDRVAEVLREWNSFQGVKSKLFDPQAAELVFWDTLKAVEAINADTERKSAVDAMNAVRCELGAEEPEPEEEPAEEPKAELKQEAPEMYVIRCSMTETQREKIIAFMKQLHVRGSIRKEKAYV